MAWYNWSQTAAANATADSSINWQEGQAPSSINDSARAMMAATAKYRDDIAGAIVTSGTSTAYTVSSYSVYDTLAHLAGQMIAFTPHVTNGAGPVTMNVDGLGAKPLRSAPNVELPAGTIIQGTPYVATYNNSDGAFYLHGFYGNPYNVPLAASMEYWAPTAPNSSFAFPYGQPISRTTYATLFGLVGTTFGSGDGSTTFNLPDVRGRVIASPDTMGAGDAGRLSDNQSSMSAVRTTLGGTGGAVTHQLNTYEMPQHNHSATVSDPGHNHTYIAPIYTNTMGGGGFAVSESAGSNYTGGAYTGISVSIGYAGSSYAHENCQPTILANRIIRII